MNKPASRFQFSLRTLLLVFVVLGSSMAVFGTGGIVAFGLVVASAVCLNQVKSLWSPMMRLALAVLCSGWLMALTLPYHGLVIEAARRSCCQGNLKQIGLALLNYEQMNGCFPPAYIADKNGNPMHSWRVLILPYLDEDPLYKSYNFNEPWDGPNNRKLLTARPIIYDCLSDPGASAPVAAKTSYIAVVGPNAAWPGAKSRNLRSLDLAGGAGRTILIVETAGSNIAWTEPRDLSLETLGAARAGAVSSMHGSLRESFLYVYGRRNGAGVVTADGAVRYLPPASLSLDSQRELLRLGAFKDEEIDFSDAALDGRLGLNWPNIAALAVWVLSVGALITRAVRSRKPRSGSPPESTPLPPPRSPNE